MKTSSMQFDCINEVMFMYFLQYFNTLKAQLTWTDMKKILSHENSTKPSLPILAKNYYHLLMTRDSKQKTARSINFFYLLAASLDDLIDKYVIDMLLKQLEPAKVLFSLWFTILKILPAKKFSAVSSCLEFIFVVHVMAFLFY